MKTSTKLKTFLIIIFIAIFAIITARYFIGLHFKKKFSVRQAPGVIVEKVEVIWPDGKVNLFENVSANKTITAKYAKATEKKESLSEKKSLLSEVNTKDLGLTFTHKENEYDDF